ncbi:MAG TPA: hypothetical protein EYP76_03960 [Thiomicrorhabdus sp.]|nr:hypothetical protein [Thiomicrorhabdus sp.]
MDPEDFQKTSVSREVIDVGGATPSNYWLGTIVLQAEIEALKARKTNDPYIASLSELYKKLSDLEVNQTIESLKSRTDIFSFSERLRTLSYQNKSLIQALENINSVDFDVYRLGVHPIEPDDPIKPKKALILAVSGGLGLMLGVFVALIRRAAKNRKELSQMV